MWLKLNSKCGTICVTTSLVCKKDIHLPDPGIKPGSCALQTDSLPSKPPGKTIYIVRDIFACLQLIGLIIGFGIWIMEGVGS